MRNAKIFLSCDGYHSWLKGVIKDNQTDKGINLEFGVAGGRSFRIFAGDKINNFFCLIHLRDCRKVGCQNLRKVYLDGGVTLDT